MPTGCIHNVCSVRQVLRLLEAPLVLNAPKGSLDSINPSVSAQQLRNFSLFEVATHWGRGDNRCCSSFSADVSRADHHLQCNLILCKTLGKLFGHQCDASATAAAAAAATAAVFCQRLVPLVPQHNIWNAAATRTTTATTNGWYWAREWTGEGRSILAKNATATNYVNYAFGWRMRLHKFYSCQHSRQHDSHTGYRAMVGRGVVCGVWSLPHILSNKLHSSV